jgi:hypothetical protein
VDLSTPTGIMPAGVTASFSPASISGTQTSQMTLTASANAALGQGYLAFMGNSPDWFLPWETPLKVVAAPVPNFTLSASPAALEIPQGGSASTSITVNPSGGFADVVSLTLPGFQGVSGSFSANPTGSGTALTIKVADSVPTGGYWLMFSGTSGGTSASGVMFLNVTPTYSFDLDVTPSPISVTAGGSGSGDVTITPHGTFSDNVDLTIASDLPDGISASFSPASTQGKSSLLISASGTVQAGNYQFNVTGAAADEALTKTVTVTVKGPAPPPDPPDFDLSASSSTLTVKGGSSGTVTLSLAPKNGFAESSTLSCSGLPTGAACTFGPPTAQNDGSTNIKLTISTAALSASSRDSGSSAGKLALALLPMVLLVSARRRKAWLGLISGLLAVLVLAGTLAGCGGGGSSSTPTQPPQTTPGETSTVTVSAVSQSGTTHTVKITLTVN